MAASTAAAHGAEKPETIQVSAETRHDEEIPADVTVRVGSANGVRELTANVRIDTPAEAAHFRHGGILPFVLRQLCSATAPEAAN